MARRASRFPSLALLVAVAPLLTAMGGGGGGALSDTIPRPEESFRAELVDRQGVRTQVEHLSCNGKTFLPLERGDGTLMVPFEKARKVSLGAETGSKIGAKVEVDGGKSLEGSLPRALLCTGVTEFGNYQIELRGLREINLARP